MSTTFSYLIMVGAKNYTLIASEGFLILQYKGVNNFIYGKNSLISVRSFYVCPGESVARRQNIVIVSILECYWACMIPYGTTIKMKRVSWRLSFAGLAKIGPKSRLRVCHDNHDNRRR